MKNKLCIVITGMPTAGKTLLANALKHWFVAKGLKVGYVDIACMGSPTFLKMSLKISELYNTDNDIVIIETHPPYLYNLGKKQKRKNVYIHLKLSHADWIKNNPLKKKTNFKFGEMFFGDFVKKCYANKDYYNGAADIYECSCVRDAYEDKITVSSVDDGKKYIINLIEVTK